MILYMSDLDGTLLTSEQKLSQETVRTINDLIESGLSFSIATARSLDSASKLIAPLRLELPMVLFNGAFVYDPVRKENIVSNFLSKEEADRILDAYEENGISAIVYTVGERGEQKVYYKGIFNKGEEDYIRSRTANGDRRFRQTDDFAAAKREQVIMINAIHSKEVLDPMHGLFGKDKQVSCHYSRDIYSGFYWLELSHANCTKRKGVETVKRLVGAEKLVCFGDQLNDIPMFEIADEAYAVAGAHPRVKALATNVIGSNDDDGVARFLRETYTH